MEDTKRRILPVIALRGITVLPSAMIHFDISRPKSIAAAEQAMAKNQAVFLVAQKQIEEESPDLKDLYKVGTIASVKRLVRLQGNVVRVLVEGIEKATLENFIAEEPIYLATVEPIKEEYTEFDMLTEEAYIRDIKERAESYARVNQKWNKESLQNLLKMGDLRSLLNYIEQQLPLNYKFKQQLLEILDTEEKVEKICGILDAETQIDRIKNRIQEKVRQRIDKNQREYVLREQLKVIREELGEDQNPQMDGERFEVQLQKLTASAEIKESITKEITRMKGMPGGSQEANVSRNYIEALLGLPWDKISEDNGNFEAVKQVLDKEHYGLEKVKDRILESLAVRQLTNKSESLIICLTGPPGTGKSSIAKSVAHALDKKYARISLGGIRDEAEIRGHRRTYIGAMPGRIIDAIRQAGVKNPVILLDEIDKVSNDYKGDTAAALLEVLDMEQNKQFRDHYIEMPVDLSEVLFIATANTTQTISPPLLDRMEIISVSSYTENEKYHIAKDYLIDKQIKKNGLKEGQLTFSQNALEKIVHNYTREAGVRTLERRIGEVCRKTAREVLEKKKQRVKITESNLTKYLGREKITFENANKEDEVGIVRGLAWTSAGGDTLSVEVNVMPGKGKLNLTGHLGDVMKESAQTALSYIRSIGKHHGIKDTFFENNDIHIHVPEGAVPKDGPSAGITMATAMFSAITEKKVYANIAMTGEVTLRGRVLPIGGLKEKILAAKKAQITKILVPFKNQPDIEELSSEIVKGLEIISVATMSEVLEQALVGKE